MNKVEIGLVISTISILFVVGGIVYYEMTSELEKHPEIKEIGYPPCITDLRLLAVVVIGVLIFCGIALKMNPVDEKDEKKET